MSLNQPGQATALRPPIDCCLVFVNIPWTMARTPRRKQNWRLLAFHSILHKNIQSGSRPANSPTFGVIKKEIGWRRPDKTPAACKMACKTITELAPRRKIARHGLIQFYIMLAAQLLANNGRPSRFRLHSGRHSCCSWTLCADRHVIGSGGGSFPLPMFPYPRPNSYW